MVGPRATVLLATVVVQLTLPGFERGGADLLWDAIPVAALGLEVAVSGGDLLGLFACALVLAFGRAFLSLFELLDCLVFYEKALDVSRHLLVVEEVRILPYLRAGSHDDSAELEVREQTAHALDVTIDCGAVFQAREELDGPAQVQETAHERP